jgi:hypothetical protein
MARSGHIQTNGHRMKSLKDPDEQKGAVEGNQPQDGGQANSNAPGLDEGGLPNDPVAIGQDVLGANEDESQG